MDRLSFSSDHVNSLILRYLQERGYGHSAYTFSYESQVSRSVFQPGEVPPGALIHIIQKGLQFIEMEANVAKEGTQSLSDYKFLHSKDLIKKDIEELRRDVQNQRGGNYETKSTPQRTPPPAPLAPTATMSTNHPTEDIIMDESSPSIALKILPEHVTSLRGHTSEVFICTWSPTDDLLASGYTHFVQPLRLCGLFRSGDASARIWNLEYNHDGSQQDPIVLTHSNGEGEGPVSTKSKDVTTMDWSPDGSLLATGSYDGHARIWTRNGVLLNTFRSHVGPVFSLKWNSKGTLLLSGSVDRRAIVWDAKTGELKQSFQFHSAATLDVDWKNNSTFATCSTDHNIYVCKVGEESPIKAFTGHENEVNAIKWDPNGNLLASCSDDTTARVWSMTEEAPILTLRDHTKEIYTVKWSPTGLGTENVHLPLLLASASFDSTVKLWDLEAGKCLHNLAKHATSVYSVAFSPDGRFLASGSFDKKLLIWSVSDGQLVKSFTGKGGIFEVCWNRTGTKVAASCSNKIVSIIDIHM